MIVLKPAVDKLVQQKAVFLQRETISNIAGFTGPDKSLLNNPVIPLASKSVSPLSTDPMDRSHQSAVGTESVNAGYRIKSEHLILELVAVPLAVSQLFLAKQTVYSNLQGKLYYLKRLGEVVEMEILSHPKLPVRKLVIFFFPLICYSIDIR